MSSYPDETADVCCSTGRNPHSRISQCRTCVVDVTPLPMFGVQLAHMLEGLVMRLLYGIYSYLSHSLTVSHHASCTLPAVLNSR